MHSNVVTRSDLSETSENGQIRTKPTNYIFTVWLHTYVRTYVHVCATIHACDQIPLWSKLNFNHNSPQSDYFNKILQISVENRVQVMHVTTDSNDDDGKNLLGKLA